jgi:hypothetical protein
LWPSDFGLWPQLVSGVQGSQHLAHDRQGRHLLGDSVSEIAATLQCSSSFRTGRSAGWTPRRPPRHPCSDNFHGNKPQQLRARPLRPPTLGRCSGRCEEVDITARTNKVDSIWQRELVLLPGSEEDDFTVAPGVRGRPLAAGARRASGAQNSTSTATGAERLRGFEFPERTLSELVGQSATSALCPDEFQGAHFQESRARVLPPAV